MNDSQRRKMDKIDREEAFFTDNAADFPANSTADDFTQQIAAEKAKILGFDAQQTSGFDDKRQAQSIYDDHRDELIDLINLFVLAASIVDDEIPGTAEKYKKPYPRTDQHLIAKATSFHTDSTAIKAQLIAAGIPEPDFGRLLTVRDAFQQAALVHDSAEEHHAEATGGMNAAFRTMMDLSRRRGKYVLMKYRDNPAKLAAWTVASHLERAPKRAPKDAPTNPPA